MSKPAKANSSRLKIIRAAVLSLSLLGFVPLFTQIRADEAAVSASTPSVISASPAPASATTSSRTQSQASSSSQRTTVTHARTRGS